MRILVFGAGAIGSTLGGLLAANGHDVTLLGRSWHLEAVRRQGLSIRGIWGERRVQRLSTATNPAQIREPAGFDWVFVCVKSHHTADVAPALQPFLGPATILCAFQNGLGNYESLLRHLPPDRVVLGRVIFGVELAPGEVLVTVCAGPVLLGAPDARVDRHRLEELAGAFRASGIPAQVTDHILVELWAKVLYNCALNGLSTLLEAPYGALPEHPMACRIMAGVVEEAYRIAAAHQIRLEPSTADAYRRLLFERLIPDTAAHHPSMLQDIRRGRPTEIESLNGALVRLAGAAGLSAPMNLLVTRLVREKERSAGIERTVG